jgi:signal transduction histidine kinase
VSRSIRWRITAIASAVTAAVLVAVAVAVVLLVRVQLRQNLDNSLEQRADEIEALTLVDDPLVNSNDEDRFTQILDDGGAVVAATSNLIGADAVVQVPGGVQSIETRSDVPIEDDDYRVLIRRFDTESGPHYVVVGENVDDLDDSVRSVTAALALTFPLVVVLVALLVWWLVGRTLRPVERIRAQVDSIDLDQLDRRVPDPGTGDEIERLAHTMNAMLARLEDSAEQQRRFVADASHELRTPVARMRMLLEVDRHGADADQNRTIAEALDDVVEMQAILDDLLFLARVDAGRAKRPCAPIDLDAVIETSAADVNPVDIVMDMSGVRPFVVDGDEHQLGRLVRNLLANAVRHATSRIGVATSVDGGVVRLVVDDDGPGIPPDQRERVFDRFVRLDDARAAGSGGTGLGLAIARDIVRLHGGSITVDESPFGGARFVVHLPGSG